MDKYKITENEKVSGVVAAPTTLTDTAQNNKMVFDRLPKLIADKFNDFVDAVVEKFKGYYTKKETDEQITERIKETGGGDMLSSEYATEGEPGVVKMATNARQLDGKNADYFMAKANFEFDKATGTLNITL